MFALSDVSLVLPRGCRGGLVEYGLLESRPLALSDILSALWPHHNPPVRPSRQRLDDDLDA